MNENYPGVEKVKITYYRYLFNTDFNIVFAPVTIKVPRFHGDAVRSSLPKQVIIGLEFYVF